MHCKKHSWENQQELPPNKEHQQDFPNKLLVQDRIYDKAIGSSQGQRTDTHTDLTTLKTRMRQESKPPRPAPWKGIASKNRGGGKKSNDELLTSFANNFHLYKTTQSNTKGKKDPHTSTRTALDICLVWTWTRLWICVAEGVLETQSMHIYIYTYIQGREVAKCCKHTLAAFSCGYDHSGVGHEVPALPPSTV